MMSVVAIGLLHLADGQLCVAKLGVFHQCSMDEHILFLSDKKVLILVLRWRKLTYAD